MKRIHLYKIFALSLLCLLFASCSSTISVKGRLIGLGNQNVHMVWYNEDGLHDVWALASQDLFEVKGKTNGPAIVLIYDGMNNLLARFIMDSGDDMQLRGDFTMPYNIEVKGSDINEQWYKFITENAGLYTSDHKQLDGKIEKFVAENPDELLSTVLVLMDYSQLNNQKQMKALLDKIDSDAKPEWLMKSYEKLCNATKKTPSRINSFLFFESKTSDFAAFSPTTAKASLLYFWVNTGERAQDVAALKQMSDTYKERLLMGDVYLDPDTASWRYITNNDGGTWHHYWTPTGPLDEQLKPFNIDRTPTFIVTDSMGNVKYHGSQVADAQKQVQQLLK